MRVWVTLLKKQKRIREVVIEAPVGEDAPRALVLETTMDPALAALDLPRPVVLKKHEKEFIDFGRTRFTVTDFIESIPGDVLAFEILIEKKKKSMHD